MTSHRFSAPPISARVLVLLALVGVMSDAVAEPPPGSGSSAKGGAVPPDHARRMSEGLALFKQHVRPVLIRHCLDCHGGKAVKGNLDLSDRKPLVDSGAIDGGSKDSLLYALITHAEEPHMPQKAARLPDGTIARIARWIDLGAPYDRPLVERKGNT